MKNSEFATADLDLAAAIMAATGRQPEVFRQPGHPLVTFEFPDDEATRAIIISYAGGDLILPVKRFAACRGLLYRFARSFSNEG
jgi:hypothetical protein